MSENVSSREVAAKNLQLFNAWVAERDAAADWPDYIRGEKVNRTEIAAECGFGLSVFRQNPAVKAALEGLEARLRQSGVLVVQKQAQGQGDEDPASLAHDRRLMEAKAKAEQRVKTLEEHNAALRAEVQDLREQLRQYKLIDEHLCQTGRLLRP